MKNIFEQKDLVDSSELVNVGIVIFTQGLHKKEGLLEMFSTFPLILKLDRVNRDNILHCLHMGRMFSLWTGMLTSGFCSQAFVVQDELVHRNGP